MSITVVDHDFGNGDASSTTIATGSGLDVQVGDILVACVQHSTAGSGAITYSGGNVSTWTSLTALSHSGVNFHVQAGWGRVTSAGSGLAVTGTIAASRPYRGIVVVQLRGADNALADSDVIEREQADGVTFSTPSLTFSRAGIIVGFTTPYESRTFTPTSPAVEVYDPASYYTGAMTREVTGAGSVNIGTTVNSGFTGFVLALGFEDADLGLPVLSAPGVNSITTTSAIPKVTITY